MPFFSSTRAPTASVALASAIGTSDAVAAAEEDAEEDDDDDDDEAVDSPSGILAGVAGVRLIGHHVRHRGSQSRILLETSKCASLTWRWMCRQVGLGHLRVPVQVLQEKVFSRVLHMSSRRRPVSMWIVLALNPTVSLAMVFLSESDAETEEEEEKDDEDEEEDDDNKSVYDCRL